MKDVEKIIAEKGIELAKPTEFKVERFITDASRWNSFLFVYDNYAKNDRMLWRLEDDARECKPIVVEEQGFLYLFYRGCDGNHHPIAFTHKDFVDVPPSGLDTIPAWWC